MVVEEIVGRPNCQLCPVGSTGCLAEAGESIDKSGEIGGGGPMPCPRFAVDVPYPEPSILGIAHLADEEAGDFDRRLDPLGPGHHHAGVGES